MARIKIPADLAPPDKPKVFGAPWAPPTVANPDQPAGPPLPPLVKPADGQVIRMTKPALHVAEEQPTERIDSPTPKKYMVTKGGQFYNSGTVALMRNGKVISDVEYNVESLKQQGIEMTELP